MTNKHGDRIAIDGAYQYNAYYHGKPIQRFWHYAKLLEAQLSLDLQNSDQILDAGCGSGLLSFFMAKDYDVNVLGIDANPSAINFCNSTYQLPNLKFRQMLLSEEMFEKNSFNKIVCLEVIEHISEAQARSLLAEFYRISKHGSLLVISTPNKKSLWPAIEFLLDFFKVVPKLKDEQHVKLYSGKELTTMAENTGFTTIEAKKINFAAPWLAPLSWKFALRVHSWEKKFKSNAGSILLYTFRKD